MFSNNVFVELRDQSNKAGVQFVLTELNVALSLLDIADLGSTPDRRQHLFADAKKAHDAVLRFLPRLIFSESEASSVNRRVQLFRGRLRRRGIPFDGSSVVAYY